jgi:uncharacterized protein DUF6599
MAGTTVVGMSLVFAALTAGIIHPQTLAFRASTTGNPSATNVLQKPQNLLAAPLPGRMAAEGPPSNYQPDTLYQYIDGGADVYLLYDFQSLAHQDFKSGAAEVTADIYDMRNADNAFGIYAAERSSSYTFMAIGIEGYRGKGALNFVQDHYYVKLSGSGAGADPLLDQLARLLSQRIRGTRTPPALLRQLPLEHRVPHSEQYIRKDPLGHAFLAPAYAVRYAWGRDEGKLLISVAIDAGAARARLDQLAKHFKQSGECAPAPEAGPDAIRARNSFEGRVLARTQGRYLLLLVNPPQQGPDILKTVAQGLH